MTGGPARTREAPRPPSARPRCLPPAGVTAGTRNTTHPGGPRHPTDRHVQRAHSANMPPRWRSGIEAESVRTEHGRRSLPTGERGATTPKRDRPCMIPWTPTRRSAPRRGCCGDAKPPEPARHRAGLRRPPPDRTEPRPPYERVGACHPRSRRRRGRAAPRRDPPREHRADHDHLRSRSTVTSRDGAPSRSSTSPAPRRLPDKPGRPITRSDGRWTRTPYSSSPPPTTG